MEFMLRIFLCYGLITLIFRIIGKKPMEYMTNYDMALVIIMANVVSETISVSSLTIASYTVAVLITITVLFNYLRRLDKVRRVLDGQSKIVIDKGEISLPQLKRARMTVEELMEVLKTKGFSNPSQVEYAIIETSGYINVIPKVVPGSKDLQEGA